MRQYVLLSVLLVGAALAVPIAFLSGEKPAPAADHLDPVALVDVPRHEVVGGPRHDSLGMAADLRVGLLAHPLEDGLRLALALVVGRIAAHPPHLAEMAAKGNTGMVKSQLLNVTGIH